MRILRLLVPAAFGALGCSSSSSQPAPHDVWQSLPPEPVPRFESYATSDGTHIWFLGGITGTLGNLATAAPSRRVDVYDPASGTWTQGPDLPADGPKHHLAVAVLNGSVYVLGGFDGILDQSPNQPFTPIAKAYVLDGGSSAWRALASPPLARGASTAQAIGTKIYLTGGAPTESVPPYAELDIYDTATDSWSKGTPMPTAREHLASCGIGGKFIVVGGWVEDVVTHAAEVYDPSTDTWTTIPDLPTARGGLEATDYNGVCHVLGGENFALPLPGTFNVHEAWDTSTSSWKTLASMPTSRHGFGFARQGGVFYAIGGGPIAGNSYTDVVEEYFP